MKSKKHNKPETRNDQSRCEFTTPDARRCTEPRAKLHASLCEYHWRREQKLDPSKSPESAALVAELLGSGAQLNTTTAVNDTLSKLVMLRARKQISARDTALIAYMIQLLLQTLHDTKAEFTRLYKWSDWDNILDRTIQRAIASDGSLQLGIPDTSAATSEFLHRRKRPVKIPATREEFAEQVLTEFALSKGMIDEPPDDDEDAEESDESADAQAAGEEPEVSDESLPAAQGQGLIDDIVKPHEFVVQQDPRYALRRGRQGN